MAMIGTLSSTDTTPLYMQIQARLREAITSKAVLPDMALPTERHLAEGFDVSRITVRKALEGLMLEGLVTRRRGSGTFVAHRLEKSFSALSSFSEDMISRGRRPESRWLSKSEGVVNPEEALALGLSPGAQVFRFQRLRFADGAVMALEYTTVPSFCLPSLSLVRESLYAALESTGHRPARALQRLRALALDARQAEKLGVAPGDPGLFIERRGFLADGRTCEINHSYYRCDAYDVVAEINQIAGR
nr:GntR family transcriptional regulator [Asticcacaulis sp. AC466]